MKHLSALLLATSLLATGSARSESIEDYRNFIIAGQTTQQEIKNVLGSPQETISEPMGDVWIYSERIELPLAVSLIPVVGDIAAILEIVRNIQKDKELIIQFNSSGIVRKSKLRKLD